MRIAFIGFGEAARAFRDSLAATDPGLSFAAYDILLDAAEGAACAAAMRERHVAVAPSPAAAVDSARWVFSAVTADQSLAAATALAPHLRSGQTVFDVNSVSPQRKKDSAALVEAAGAAYVDMAVMAPVHPRGHRTPVLLGGAQAGTVEELGALGFSCGIAGDRPGDATAIKMVRSLFVKGLEAITVETLLAARAAGCLDTVLASLRESYPGFDLDTLAAYHFERTLRHGRRRAAEMRESARTLDELGLAGRLADAIADVQEAMGRIGPSGVQDETLPAMVAAVADRRRGRVS